MEISQQQSKPLNDLKPSDGCRFELADVGNWTQHLEEYGYVIIKSIALKEDCDHAKSLFWDFVESVPGRPTQIARRNDIATWSNGNWIPDTRTGIINGYGFGQSNFCWHTRLLPEVEAAFKAIWGVDKRLLVSYDGGNAFR